MCESLGRGSVRIDVIFHVQASGHKETSILGFKM